MGQGRLPAGHWLRLVQLADDVIALHTQEVFDICVGAAGPVNCIGQ